MQNTTEISVSSPITAQNFVQLIECEKNNPDLHSQIDIPTLLKAAENVDMDYLGNRSLIDISTEIFASLQNLGLASEKIRDFCSKLAEYRFVDQIYQLHKGKHVRWLRTQSKGISIKPINLTNGGIVVNIKFLDDGVHILCKNGAQFIQYRFDECLTFQKLSDDEQMILSCYEILRRK